MFSGFFYQLSLKPLHQREVHSVWKILILGVNSDREIKDTRLRRCVI